MKNPLCDAPLLRQPTRTEHEDLYPGYIANCAFNAFLSITAIIFNSVTIQALRRTSSLSKPLRTLLLSLAVSDLGVGLLVQPFYIVLLVQWLQKNTENSPSCAVYSAFSLIGVLFSTASFFGVMALSADRFLAIHLHLRYQELLTHKRVLSVVVSLWAFTAALTLFIFCVSKNISSPVFATIGVACLVVSAVFYYNIYSAVRRHRNQIQAMQIQQVEQDAGMAANLARRRKSAVCAFYVYLVFFICNLSVFCSYTAVLILGLNNATKMSLLSSWTLVFLNSSLNPVIYCWKMRHIRHAIMDILRNLFPSHNWRPSLRTNAQENSLEKNCVKGKNVQKE